MRTPALLWACLLGVLTGCPKDAKPAAAAVVDAGPPKPTYDTLSRKDFNLRAQALFVPLFWRADANGNKAVDPGELAVLWSPHNAKLSDFVEPTGEFSKRFELVYKLMAQTPDFSKLPPEEKARREAVLLELEQGQPTLIETDLSQASAEDKAVAEHLFRAAVALERIYAKQLGTAALKDKVPPQDLSSQALFHRNQSPFCVAPKTEKNAACSALTEKLKPVSGLYPADVQADKGFCDVLAKQKNGKALMDHFSVVEKDGAGFKAVPYSQAYQDDMEVIAKELELAADAVKSEGEAAFKAYLTASAKAFRTNDWEVANEAWGAMSATNSKWYLRIAPDEVYYEPCAWKAGFALNFSRINPDSVAWQNKLEPVKQEMEEAIATLGGPPYKARQVKFKLPDFIDVVLNAGDQRNAHGATIGQSLPNWGAVAAKGGRTVTMTNLYTDADSQETLKGQMASLFCADTMGKATTDSKPAVMSVVLHEAAHNLGPSHEYKVKGKEDDEVFGGPLAATMEELKAQSAALYFSDWLVGKGLLTAAEAEAAHVRDVAWGFGHVSRGMYDGTTGRPKNYSQLAAIQLGTLNKAGVLVWRADEKAANGQDTGCFALELSKWKDAVDVLAKRVVKAKATGDKKDAEAMKAEFVDSKGDDWAKHKDVITERWIRAPKATFVYSVKR